MKNEDAKSLVKHEWSQIIVVILTITGLFFWSRSESRADYRDLKASTESHLAAIKQDAKEFREMWAAETKEFHARLCVIEERNRE